MRLQALPSERPFGDRVNGAHRGQLVDWTAANDFSDLADQSPNDQPDNCWDDDEGPTQPNETNACCSGCTCLNNPQIDEFRPDFKLELNVKDRDELEQAPEGARSANAQEMTKERRDDCRNLRP